MSDLNVAEKVIGTKQTLKAVRDGKALRVVLAEDTEAAIKDEILAVCEEAGVIVEAYASKSALGEACGIERAAAVVTLLKSSQGV